MAEDIRILDLADPQLPQSFIEQSKLAAPMADAMQLELGALMDQAAKETGLSDFGELDFQERVEVILTGLREDAPLTPIGKLSGTAQLASFLNNRLLLEDLGKRHRGSGEVEGWLIRVSAGTTVVAGRTTNSGGTAIIAMPKPMHPWTTPTTKKEIIPTMYGVNVGSPAK